MISPKIQEKRKKKCEFILSVALKASAKKHYSSIKYDDLIAKSHLSRALIQYYFPKVCDLHKALVNYAIENNIDHIILQAISVDDKLVKKLPHHVKQRAVLKILG